MTTAPDRAREDVTLRESIPPVREWARTFLVGLFMGTADAVPGVSGGTIALIAGVYERLIAAITAVTPGRFVDGVRALTPLDGGISLDRAAAVLEEVDGWFLIALLAGIMSAVVVVTRVVDVANEAVPVLLFGFFFGLIAASGLILLRAVSIRTAAEGVAAVAGFVVAFVVSGYGEVLESGGLPVVFGAGALAVSAMILPGISGSLILVILSQYERMSSTLSEFVDALVSAVTGNGVAPVVDHGIVVVTFVCGGLVGLFTISRLVRRALDASREVTFAFLVALVIGALRAPIVTLNGDEYDVVWSTDVVGAFAGAAVVGAVVVLALDWYAVDIDLDGV
jgi:putative membrane protein